MKLLVENNASKEDIKVIQNGLDEYNKKFAPSDNYQPLQVFLKDKDNNIQGGVLGASYWNWLVIEYFWIAEELRSQGYGTKMLVLAEQEGIKRGCKNAHLDTLSFQAFEFYKNNGYKIFGQLDDLPEGAVRYFLKKQLVSI